MSDDNDERDVDATGADPEEREAKDEFLEALGHLKSATSILFNRAAKDPAVKEVAKEASRVAKQIGDAAEPLAKQVGDAAEPLARQLGDEVGRLTRDVMNLVDGKRGRKRKRAGRSDEEE
ncbi:MAG: hypothetical protein AB8I08_21715 [Sandaracinaceae bacterium]